MTTIQREIELELELSNLLARPLFSAQAKMVRDALADELRAALVASRDRGESR